MFSLTHDVFVLTAPSGTGKSTIVKRLRSEVSSVEFSISHTTRAQRPGERDGEHYWFVSKEHFKKMVAQQRMLEWAEVFGNFYGTSIDEIKRIQEQGHKPLLEIDVQGWIQVRQLVPLAHSIFLMPPSIKELWSRLATRGTDSFDVRWRRFMTARQELDQGGEYQYFVINDDLERAYQEICGFVTAQVPFSLSAEAGRKYCRQLLAEFDGTDWQKTLKPD